LNARKSHCTDIQNILQRIYFKYVLETSPTSDKVCVCVCVCVLCEVPVGSGAT
jgi:hypothetical protein